MFKILSESDLRLDLQALTRAWESEPSFVLIPSPSPVDDQWLSHCLTQLSAGFAVGHFVILTSGSTGLPKLVVGNKLRTTQLAREIHQRQDLEEVQAAVLALPLSYSYSLVNQWVWAHVHNRRLVATKGLSEPSQLLATLAETPASMLCMVGSMLPIFKRYIEPGKAFPEVIRINFAGGPFPQADLPWLRAVFPSARIFHNYGCSEALPRLTIRPAESDDDPMVLGAPVKGVELQIDEHGQLRFRSPYSAVALVDQQGIKSISENEWVATGDLAEIQDNGRLRLLGRSSEVFKRYGEKISLPLLAQSLRQVWAGDIAFYTEDTPQGETGHVLVLAPHADKEDAKRLMLHLRHHFRRQFWPIRIEAATAIPLLANGKADISVLKSAVHQLLWKQIM